VKRKVYVLLPVTGGSDFRKSEHAVVSLDRKSAETFLEMLERTRRLNAEDALVAHVAYHGAWCDWLPYRERLENLLRGRECARLDKKPSGKPVAMDCCYVEVWEDELYFTGYEGDSGPRLEAGPLTRTAVEDALRALAVGHPPSGVLRRGPAASGHRSPVWRKLREQ
jgi:hypothetical protein